VKLFCLSSETGLPIKPFYLSNATCTATARRVSSSLQEETPTMIAHVGEGGGGEMLRGGGGGEVITLVTRGGGGGAVVEGVRRGCAGWPKPSVFILFDSFGSCGFYSKARTGVGFAVARRETAALRMCARTQGVCVS
jgi:hypothetical protein